MIGPLLGRLLRPTRLRPRETRRAFDTLVSPATTDAERAALLVGLACRKSDPAELTAFAREMRRRGRRFRVPSSDRPIDLCGSGGAPQRSFNVSTVSAFVTAAAGVPVVKHGNRSTRGPCGSSDLLTALGLPVTESVEFARRTYRAHRLAFLHAPLFHPATAAVATARRLVGVPTIFNRLGPLTNPAAVPRQVSGTSSVGLAAMYAAALPRLGVRHGLTYCSSDGTDELSPRAHTTAFVFGGGRVRRIGVRPETMLSPAERRGSWGALNPDRAARATERLLAGRADARMGSVLLTSGAALWTAGRAEDLGAGVRLARETVRSGAAESLLEAVRAIARGRNR